MIHFKGLNGIRALAALGVLFAHITSKLNDFGLNRFVFGMQRDGTRPQATLLSQFGVTIFFVLSGFLITYLLLTEKKTGKINVRSFYMRRILRIWPLYYLYLLVVLGIGWFCNDTVQASSVALYVLFAANIPYVIGGNIELVTHFWSIGVEEQFYAIWPWITKKSNLIVRTSIVILIIWLVLKTCLRIVDIHFNSGIPRWPYWLVYTTRIDCMLMGAIAAMLYERKNKTFVKLTNNKPVQFLSWIVIGLVTFNLYHVFTLFDHEIISLVGVALIIGQIEVTNRLVNLDNKVMDWIGHISYGIYVIHPLIIYFLSLFLNVSAWPSLLAYVFVYAIILLLTLLISYLSYNLYEKKFIVLKRKFSVLKTRDSVRN